MAVVLHFAYPMPLTAIQKVGMVDKSLGSSSLWNVIYTLGYYIMCPVLSLEQQHYISE